MHGRTLAQGGRSRLRAVWFAVRVALLMLLVGCGATPAVVAPTSDAPAPIGRSSDGDLAARVADARARCQPGRAWRLSYEQLPVLDVAEGRALRAEVMGLTLIGTDAKHWLTCDTCGTATRHCFPVIMPTEVAFELTPSCQIADAEGEPWHGRATVRAQATCGHETFVARFVPELDEVKRALVESGVIDRASILATREGLLVELLPQLRLLSVDPVACDVFDVIDGEVHGSSQDMELAAFLHQKVDAGLQIAARDVQRRFEQVVTMKALGLLANELALLCSDAGESTDTPDATKQCVERVPEARRRLDEVATAVAAKDMPELRANIDRLTGELIRDTHCNAFVKSSE
jgi:hypothetical protein